ncbi:MAG: GNAT family N-acetyltransferase [Pseudomonadota bacterium]|jgi:acetyltransferase
MKPPEYRDRIRIAGTEITLRTLRPEDRAIEEAFVRGLSPTSRYLRFHSALPALTPEMAERFLNLDYPDQMALIATIPDGDGERQIAVARWARPQGEAAADLGIAVADDWQGKGLGTALLQRLLRVAAEAGIDQIAANVLHENHRMRALARDLGFRLAPHQDDPHTLLLIRAARDDG